MSLHYRRSDNVFPPPLHRQRLSLQSVSYRQKPFRRGSNIRRTVSGYRRLEEDANAEFDVVRRPSICLPHLQQTEKLFFEIVAEGDVDEVKQFLQDNPGFNINCVNFQGVSALLIAVQTKNESMVEFLISQKTIDIGDCVLHAVRDNQIKILEMLLEKLQEVSPGLEYVGVIHSTNYPDHMTPLILAAQCGHYEIIELLTDRGHRIYKPHTPGCLCPECKTRLEHEDLLHAETFRLNLYKAITNPAYICHSTQDPILVAFQLSYELRQCAMLIPEFRAAYNQLSDDISAFAVELVGVCRSTEEMELILVQKNGINAPGIFCFPRLILAVDFKQKEFVSHPNTQQMVEYAWNGDWYEWRLKPLVIRYLYPLYRLLMMPLITVMCIICPTHALVKHWQIPLNKMISHTACYICFLTILFFQANMDKVNQKRLPPNCGLEPLIILFTAGYLWNCIRLCAIQGIRRHFRHLWNWHEIIMILLLISTFAFWFLSIVDAQQEDQIDLERKYWNALDPVLLSEGTLALATIMAYFKILFICRLNYYLGPLQISLGKMSADIAKYLTLFVVTIISFTVGMCKFYQYYKGMVQTDDDSGIKTVQVPSFVNFNSALKTFFWALFCMSPLESTDVIIENLPGTVENKTIINEHYFTQIVGSITFAIFMVLTVIIILNMFIATMSNTFQRVTDNVDVECTFGKTQVYIEYMLQTTLPPPFNLIPTACAMKFAIEWMQALLQKPEGIYAKCSLSHCCYIEKDLEDRVTKEFPVLMTQLAQRYFREKDSEVEMSEIEGLRQELLEIKVLISNLEKSIT